MKRTALLPLAVAGVLLAGCSGQTAAPATSAVGTATSQDFLATHGLGGMTATQIIEKLDASEDDRANGPMGSVRPTQLVLTDKTTNATATLPMPKDQFYLAMAPYEQSTHECFNHNLATCKGEIVRKAVHVKLVDTAGKTIVDRDITTYANGFASTWVPKDIKGTLTVSYNGKSVSAPVSTTDADPTCITTPLHLS